MKKSLLTTLVFSISTLLMAQSPLQEANDAYVAEQYDAAIERYEAVLTEQGESANLYYNLANAYYKTSQYPAAILNYERAILLDPQHKDARFNLQLAEAHIVDQIEPIDTFILTLWVQQTAQLLHSNSWAVIAIASFILTLVALFFYLFSHRVAVKKIGFFGAILLLLLSVAANRFAYMQKLPLVEKNRAIVFAPSITVKSSPAESGTALFVLHEGTKVTLLDAVGEWSEVLLSDGNRGWIPTKELEVI